MLRPRVRIASVAAALVLTGLLGLPGHAQQPSEEKFRQMPGGFPDWWIVKLNDQAAGPLGPQSRAGQIAADLNSLYGGTVTHIYTHVLNGFAIQMPEGAARALSLDPRVDHVQQAGVRTLSDTQLNPPSWGLDRVDQRSRPLDVSYSYDFNGAGVHVYVIDTGIRPTHTEFGGRASIVEDFTGDGQNGHDCHGHGTHVAGTIGGSTVGVAKNVTLHAIRVFTPCGDPRPFAADPWLISAAQWVTANRINPAVVNMSLGGPPNPDIDQAVRDSIASGVTYVVAAGNDGVDAGTTTPARVAEAITVGGTDITDVRATWNNGRRSNYGAVLDLFAPGKFIFSAWIDSDTATATIEGTSMAAPHVTGVVAQYLHRFGGGSPPAVRDAIVNAATPNIVGDPGPGSPNRLLFSAFVKPAAPSISFQASNGQWMVAENNGGGIVNANRNEVGAFETFSIEDFNGGGLFNGDPVALRTDTGWYLQAVDGGGGAFLAVGGGPFAWETFTIVLLSGADSRVDDGEFVALRSNNGHYVVAEGGGGGIVNCNRTEIQTWETWRIWLR